MEEFILTLKNLWLNYHVWLCVVLSFILRSIYVCPFNIGFSSPIWILDNTRAIYNKMSSHKIPTNSWSYLLQPLTILKAVWDNLCLNFITPSTIARQNNSFVAIVLIKYMLHFHHQLLPLTVVLLSSSSVTVMAFPQRSPSTVSMYSFGTAYLLKWVLYSLRYISSPSNERPN